MKKRKSSKINHLESFSRFYREIQEKSDVKIKGYIDIQRAKSDEDMKRHVSALSEDFQSRVEAIGEQFGGLNNRLDSVDKRLDSHSEMVGKLLVSMDVVKTNVEFMKDSLKKKVDYDEFIALERRVPRLNQK
jgi:DNA repair exonuclease SbcCD ATPase subunit